jgi:hypothetical protein
VPQGGPVDRGHPTIVEPVAQGEQRREDEERIDDLVQPDPGQGRGVVVHQAEVQERDGRAQEISCRVDQEGDPTGTARLGHVAIVNRGPSLQSRRVRRFEVAARIGY